MAIVIINSTEEQYEVDNQTNLLEGLEEQGFDINFSCQAGICGTCECDILEGAQNLNNLTEEEQEYYYAENPGNRRLICQVTIKKGTVILEPCE